MFDRSTRRKYPNSHSWRTIVLCFVLLWSAFLVYIVGSTLRIQESNSKLLEKAAKAQKNKTQKPQLVNLNSSQNKNTYLYKDFGNGFVKVSAYGDIYAKDGFAPTLGTALHPYSALNLTNAS